jgi:hypothetical protein
MTMAVTIGITSFLPGVVREKEGGQRRLPLDGAAC